MTHSFLVPPLKILTIVLVLLVTGCATPETAETSADASQKENQLKSVLKFQEWPVPWKATRPRDPYKSPDGTIWFVGQAGDYAGRLYPETGEIKRYELPKGAGPHTVIVDKNGTPWYAGNRDKHIGRINPKTGEIKRYEMPEGVNDPHTMAWTSTGKIWFTAQRSEPAGYIGLFNPKDGKVQHIQVPGNAMRPYGIVVDKNDRPWIAFMGTNAIGTVDPRTMKLRIIHTPTESSRIRRLALDSQGRIWWVDAASGYMGVYNPKDDSMKQWMSPSGKNASLYAAAMDHKDRFWYVETGKMPNRFIGFDTKLETFLSMDEVPSGAGAVRHMYFDPQDKVIWFGADTNTVGRAVLPE